MKAKRFPIDRFSLRDLRLHWTLPPGYVAVKRGQLTRLFNVRSGVQNSYFTILFYSGLLYGVRMLVLTIID